MAISALTRLRRLCLALPGAEEIETWDHQTFRVRRRIFAMHVPQDGRPAVWMKAPPGVQELLVEADPARFFRPPYVGPRGWIGVRLHGRPDWAQVAAMLRRSHAMTAPKSLRGGVGGRGKTPRPALRTP